MVGHSNLTGHFLSYSSYASYRILNKVHTRHFPKGDFPSGNFPKVQFPKQKIFKGAAGYKKGRALQIGWAMGPRAVARTDLGSFHLGNCKVRKLELGEMPLGKYLKSRQKK